MNAKYAVLGNPISHSLSPKIHRMFADHQGVQLTYEKFEAPLDDFSDFVAELYQQGYHGLNVTMPFKLQAYALTDAVTEHARLAGAVNTLIRTDHGWRGDNTDGAGLTNDLYDLLQQKLAGSKILILGAGGSVQGILPALVAEQVDAIHIANRTADKAVKLAKAATEKFKTNSITGSGLDFTPNTEFDILINATASGLSGEVPALKHLPVVKRCCYDLFYAAEPTAFMRWCETKLNGKNELVVADGLGMLVRQAAASYTQWRSPDLTEDIVKQVFNELKQSL